MAASAVRYLDQVTGYGWAVLGVGVTEAAWRGVVGLAKTLNAANVHICAGDMLPDAVPDGVPVLVDVDGALNAGFGQFRGQFLLVRPDHVLAAAWRPGGEQDVAAAVMTWTAAAATHDSSR
jgi:3-(3-hydroxy-phenyl)propionate hydroxylase